LAFSLFVGFWTLILLLFLREIFTASAASPPVDIEPATIDPRADKQNGHMLHLLALSGASQAAKLNAQPPFRLATGHMGPIYISLPKKIRSLGFDAPNGVDVCRQKQWWLAHPLAKNHDSSIPQIIAFCDDLFGMTELRKSPTSH
jgi:hypothetical protein